MPAPYEVKISFSPLRLRRDDDKPVEMSVYLKNLRSEDALTSLVVEIPDPIGFDRTAFVKRKELRIGKLAPGESKTFVVELYPKQKAQPGTYPIKVSASRHYKGYTYVLDYVDKEVSLRVV